MKFAPGTDSRRNRAGRPPSARTLASTIRNILGRDAPATLQRLKAYADSGDPAALAAVGIMLALVSATPQKGPQAGQDSEVAG